MFNIEISSYSTREYGFGNKDTAYAEKGRLRALSPATKYDTRKLKLLLQDFCIDTEIPQFRTIQEMEAWRARTIRASLN
jgi:hypothetical protein